MVEGLDGDAIFNAYQPHIWTPSGNVPLTAGIKTYFYKQDHGVKGSPELYELDDPVNKKRNDLEKVVVGYNIKGNRSPLFTVKDVIAANVDFDERFEDHIAGQIGEHISRRITKYFLKQFTPDGRRYGRFDQFSAGFKRDDHVIKHAGNYVLKTVNYPNTVILQQTGRGKFGYQPIAELDGLFFYEFSKEQHIIVMESKMGGWKLKARHLLNDIFKPLHLMFPDAKLSYIVFGKKQQLYGTKDISEKEMGSLPKALRRLVETEQTLRVLRDEPRKLYEQLTSRKINTMFFTFNETDEEMAKIKKFMINSYRRIHDIGLSFSGRVETDGDIIKIWNGASTPFFHLVRDPATGLYRRVDSNNDISMRVTPHAKEAHKQRIIKKQSGSSDP